MIYIGVDVSNIKMDVAVFEEGNGELDLGEFENSKAGLTKLSKKLKKSGFKDTTQWHFIIDPTGGYEKLWVHLFHKQTWRVSIPNSQRVREWAKGMGIRVKTDPIDARTLARYGCACRLPAHQPTPESIEHLDAMLHRRQDLQAMQQAERNRLKIARRRPDIPAAVYDNLQLSLSFIAEQIALLDDQIDQLIAQDQGLFQQRKQLLSVPGVGAKNALLLLVLCHRWLAMTAGEGDAKALTSFVGLDVVHKQSGSSVFSRPMISRMGNPWIRAMLYMGAVGGSTGKNTPLSHFYKRLVERGKPKKVALVASARKILVWSWAVFSNDCFFDRSRYSLRLNPEITTQNS